MTESKVSEWHETFDYDEFQRIYNSSDIDPDIDRDNAGSNNQKIVPMIQTVTDGKGQCLMVK